jgi:DNA primase
MESEWVDFRLVKQSVSMQMVLDHYHINGLRKNGNELRGQCPIHKGEGARSFHVNVSKNVFQCFSCKAKGNILDFVAAMEQSGIRDAALKLKGWFEVGESHPQETAATERNGKQTEEIKPSGLINPPLSFQLRADPGHGYGLDRGVSRETLEYFGAGMCVSKGMFSGRFVIPLQDAAGQLVGYAGRSVDDAEPKYLFPSAEKGFYKRSLLFNLHRVLESVAFRDPVVILEGFFGCFKVRQAGYPGVTLLGSSLSREQEELICEHFRKALLLFDGDDAGRRATDDCLQRLGCRLWIKAISLPDAVQPDQLSTEEIQAMLAASL